MKCLMLCAILLGAVNLNAQLTDFKLSDYKYRTPLFQARAMDLDLDQSASSGSNNSTSAGLKAQLQSIKSSATDKRQHISMRHLGLFPRYATSKTGNTKNLNNGMGAVIGYSRLDRTFKQNYFIETGGEVEGRTNHTKSGVKNLATSEGRQDVRLELTAGVGKGRLEYVHDAQAALLILEELASSGIGPLKVEKETAHQFAQLITSIKKRRLLDWRRRTIYQLNQVDSFLRAHKVVKQCDATSMAIINDILFYSFQNDLSDNMNSLEQRIGFDWARQTADEGYEGVDFGFIPQLEPYSDQAFRQHGTIMYARFKPAIRYDDHRIKTERAAANDSVHKDSYLLFEPGVQLGYEKHQAQSLKWQRNYRASLIFTPSKFLNSKAEEHFTSAHTTNIFLNYDLGYYPNSRSVVEGGGQIRLMNFGGAAYKSTTVIPSVELRAGYFLSYNTVLRAQFSMQYYTPVKGPEKATFSENFRIYFRHYFY